MSKIRFQMFLDESQKEVLEKVQQDSKIPIAEIIRKAIDSFLKEWKKNKKIPAENDITEKLLLVAGVCKGGPKDLADKHDRYLYGLFRKWKKFFSIQSYISFFDFTSFVVMKEIGIPDVLTADRHFEEVGLGFKKLF